MPKIDDSFIFALKDAVSREVSGIKNDSLNRIVDNITGVYGGEMVYIGKNYKNALSVRNSKIRNAHTSGNSIATLSTKFLLSERQIIRITKKT